MLVNLVHKALLKHKVRNYGLGLHLLNVSAINFGLPKTWRSNVPFSKKYDSRLSFNLSRAKSSLTDLVLSSPKNYNLSLKRFLTKRIRILKINRSLRGVRHSQFLPVRGQKTKTNARTQKSRRK